MTESQNSVIDQMVMYNAIKHLELGSNLDPRPDDLGKRATAIIEMKHYNTCNLG